MKMRFFFGHFCRHSRFLHKSVLAIKMHQRISFVLLYKICRKVYTIRLSALFILTKSRQRFDGNLCHRTLQNVERDKCWEHRVDSGAFPRVYICQTFVSDQRHIDNSITATKKSCFPSSASHGFFDGATDRYKTIGRLRISTACSVRRKLSRTSWTRNDDRFNTIFPRDLLPYFDNFLRRNLRARQIFS